MDSKKRSFDGPEPLGGGGLGSPSVAYLGPDSSFISSSHAASSIGGAGRPEGPALAVVEQPPRLEVALQLVVPGRHLCHWPAIRSAGKNV